jgi:hypothetical protein
MERIQKESWCQSNIFDMMSTHSEASSGAPLCDKSIIKISHQINKRRKHIVEQDIMERISHQSTILDRPFARMPLLEQSLPVVEHKSREIVSDVENVRTATTILEFTALATTSPNIELKTKNKETELITTTNDWNASFGQKQCAEELIKLREKIIEFDKSAIETKDSYKEAYHVLLNKFTINGVQHTPHPLAVVDEAAYQKLKDNTILLCDMKRFNVSTTNHSDGGQTTFSIENWGGNIPGTFKEMNGNSFVVDTLDIPLGFIFFMCRASEKCLVSDPSIVFVGDKNRTEDYVILFLCVSDVIKLPNMEGTPNWKNVEDFKLLKKGKKSTIKGNKGTHHYGSIGKCYSFGMRNSYNSIRKTQVSLTNYAGDGSAEMKEYKRYIWKHFHAVFMSFDRILAGLSCKLNVCAESIQNVSKNTALDKYVINAEDIERGKILTASININCQTRDLHCEKDVTYTTIMVPFQEDATSFIVFEFKLFDWGSFKFRCLQNSGFTYSAYCLTHRQCSINGTNCMNLSSYSNKNTFCHFRRTYDRLKKRGDGVVWV